jgi:hypothetical protein
MGASAWLGEAEAIVRAGTHGTVPLRSAHAHAQSPARVGAAVWRARAAKERRSERARDRSGLALSRLRRRLSRTHTRHTSPCRAFAGARTTAPVSAFSVRRSVSPLPSAAASLESDNIGCVLEFGRLALASPVSGCAQSAGHGSCCRVDSVACALRRGCPPPSSQSLSLSYCSPAQERVHVRLNVSCTYVRLNVAVAGPGH